MSNLFKKIFTFSLAKTGFTLLEVMIATLVVSIGLVGILSLIIQNIQVQYINKNTLIASQLVQEGLEMVRNVRDGNWLSETNDWDDKISNGGTYTFTIDYLGNIDDTVNAITDTDAKLYINSDYYDHDNSGLTTPFARLISVTDNGDYLDVECTVRAIARGKHYDYVVETMLHNWR